jgi:hypothetical protein
MRRQEVQSTRKTSLGSLDPIEKAVVAKFTKQIGNIEEVLSMHDAPDAPVWAANCSYGTEIILAWNRAKRAVMYEIRSEDADWGEEGYVWQGTSTMITLPARTRSETFYIKSINAAGIYSEQASAITLENEAPSAPVFTLVPSTSGFTVLLSDTESDVVKVVLSITEVDEQQKPLGETVQRVCEEKTYFFAAEPRTSWKVSAVAYDSIGAGEESAAKYVTVSGIDAWHIIDIPEHIVSPSHLTESLMEEIESAVDGVDYLDGQMSEARQRLSQAESELGSIDGRVTYTETKINELEGEIATKVSQTDYNALVGRVETAETNITQNAQAIATKASQSSVDVLEGRVSAAESTITQQGNAISSVVAEVESIDGRVETAESAITQLGNEITLKVQVRQDGKLVIAGIGMAVDEDGQSEVAMLADRFRVLTSVDGEMKSVFAVDTETGKVYVLGDLIATGLIRATEVQAEVAKHLLLAAEVATVDHLGALKIEAGAITVGGSAPGIPLTKPEGAKLWHFDGSLVSTDGTAPESGAVATLRPDGRFGGAVAVEEGTTNKIATEGGAAQDWSKWSHWGARTYWQSETQYDDPVMGKVFQGTAGNATFLYHYYPYAFTSGVQYTLSVYLKADRVITKNLWFNLVSRVGGLHTIASEVISATITTEWQRFSAALTPNETTAAEEGGFGINFGSGNEGVVYCAARPQLEQKPFATSFVDGTRADGTLRYPHIPFNDTSFTVAAWVRCSESNSADDQTILEQRESGTVNKMLHLVIRYRRPHMGFWDNDLPGVTIVDDGAWHHIVFVYDKVAQKQRIYVDGRLDVERTATPYKGTAGDTCIGSPTSGSGRRLNGLIDELLILPYAATPEQIQAWYAMGAPFHDPQGIVDGASTPVHVNGSGGTLHIDSQGETWVRKSDGKVMFRFDANTGDAEYAGKLGAKVIEADNYKQVPVVDTYNVMDSFDSSHPLEIPIYIDEGMTIHDVRITARGMRYRAYASGSSAGGSHSHDVEIEGHKHIIPFALVAVESQAASIKVNLSDHASHSHTYDKATEASATLADLKWSTSQHSHSFSGSDTVSISISGNTGYAGTPDYHAHSFSGSDSDSVSISGTTGSSSQSYVYNLSQGLHEHEITTTSTTTGSGGPTSHYVIMNPPNGTHTHAVPLSLPLGTTESGGAQIQTSTSVDSHTHNLIYGIFDDTGANGLPKGVDLWFSNSENRSYTKVADLSEPGTGVNEFQLCQGTALPVSGTGWKWVKFTTTTKGRISAHIVIRGFQDSWE